MTLIKASVILQKDLCLMDTKLLPDDGGKRGSLKCLQKDSIAMFGIQTASASASATAATKSDSLKVASI